MNNYNNNNFLRAPGSDSPIRFKKRPRYNVNSDGANNGPRYNKYPNQTGYQFSHNRNNATDNYQHSQYEKQPNKYFYTHSTKRLNNYIPQQNNKQSSNLLHKSIPTSPTFSHSTQSNNLTSQIERQPANTPSVTTTAKNNQHQPIFTPNNVTITAQNNQNQTQFTANNMDNTNYYGFPYNFYPSTYSGNSVHNTSTIAFSMVEGMSSSLWQTITSTPPPKLQQQPPHPQRQPPALATLPISERYHLPPPPPIPSSITDLQFLSTSSENFEQNDLYNCQQDSGAKTIIKMKAKRKAMSERYKLSKSWSEKVAQLALEAEEANVKKLRKDFILVIRFPDPEISREMVKNYSPDIESVHFQLNYAPRYCLIHLKPDADVEKTIDHLSKIPFGSGYLSAEIKQVPHKVHSTKLNEIDPFTLYVGNLPTTIACKTLKELFPGAARIDIGFSQRMKYSRYAFIRYQNVHHAIEAYRRMLDEEIDGRTLTIRFRRLTPASEGNKDGEAENNDDLHDDIVVSQPSVAQHESHINESIPTVDENSGMTESLTDKSTNACDDLTKCSEKDVAKESNNADMMPAQINNSMETHDSNENPPSTTITNAETEARTKKISNELICKVKPEPNIDPDDVVIRNNTLESQNELNVDTVKVERALFEEFFERPLDPNERSENLSRSTRNSLTSSTDDTDTISQLSSNSLGEFLQTCQRLQTHGKNIKTAEQPRNNVTIKSEHLEAGDNSSRDNLIITSNNPTGLGSIKREGEDNNETLMSSDNSIRTIESEANTLSRKSASTNCENPANNSSNNDDDDDIVPPTALFFTSEYKNKWAKSKSNCDNENFYAEFYDTNVCSQATSSQTNVKAEPMDTSINNNSIRTREKRQRTDVPNLNGPVSNNHPLMEMSNKSSTIKFNTDNADDDLVPQPNLLGGYQRNGKIIKREEEYDDIFSKPFPESHTSWKELSVSNSSSHSKQCENVSEVQEPQAKECSDEDVIIVSANIPPAKIQKKSDNPLLNNIFVPRYNDIVSFNNKPVSISIPSRKTSSFFHHNHLDRLYDQLDTDSDSEL